MDRVKWTTKHCESWGVLWVESVSFGLKERGIPAAEDWGS